MQQTKSGVAGYGVGDPNSEVMNLVLGVDGLDGSEVATGVVNSGAKDAEGEECEYAGQGEADDPGGWEPTGLGNGLSTMLHKKALQMLVCAICHARQAEGRGSCGIFCGSLFFDELFHHVGTCYTGLRRIVRQWVHDRASDKNWESLTCFTLSAEKTETIAVVKTA